MIARLPKKMLRSLSILPIVIVVNDCLCADEIAVPAFDTKLYEQSALSQMGDIVSGKKLFFEDKRLKCSVCHRVDAEGGNVGPELSKIGGKFDRPHLVESLLEPSRQIVEGFRSSSLRLQDDSVVTGVVKQRTDQVLRLLDVNNLAIEVAVSEIVEEKVSDVSIMPANIASSLSTSEFVDLIAYLESLRSSDGKMGAGVKGPVTLPDGFRVRTLITGLSGAVAMEVLDENRILVCEQSGELRLVRNGELVKESLLKLPVEMNWERGLIGVTVDPNFAKEPYVYVCYVAHDPYPHHVISRFVMSGDAIDPASEQLLLVGDDQRKLGGKVPAGHQGGALHFGRDGSLFIGIGEQTNGSASQRLDTLQGKILRIHRDGAIPDDNPLVAKTHGKYRAIWAYGLRNPFTFAIDSLSGEMLINDVGGKFEEINRGLAGGNYGWQAIEHGPTTDPAFVGPIHIYPQASISGGDFVPSNSDWPDDFRGKYLFADFVHGWIHAIDSTAADAVSNNGARKFAEGLRRPVDIRFSKRGSLYVLLRNAWVADDKFQTNTGSILEIQFEKEK